MLSVNLFNYVLDEVDRVRYAGVLRNALVSKVDRTVFAYGHVFIIKYFDAFMAIGTGLPVYCCEWSALANHVSCRPG